MTKCLGQLQSGTAHHLCRFPTPIHPISPSRPRREPLHYGFARNTTAPWALRTSHLPLHLPSPCSSPCPPPRLSLDAISSPLRSGPLPSMTPRRFFVNGAGAVGLVAARELRWEGLRVVVFERSGAVGGTWLHTLAVESVSLGLDPFREVVHSTAPSSTSPCSSPCPPPRLSLAAISSPLRSGPLPSMTPRRFFVIGTGAISLVAARELRWEGLRVVVFERGGAIGGTWLHTPGF